MNNLINDAYKIDRKQLHSSFNAAALDYDAASLLQQTVANRLIEAFDMLKIEPVSILDLGSGTGYGSEKIKQRFKKAQIYQADISSEMLKVARKREPMFFSKKHFVCSDASQMPIAKNQFDLVFSNLMLQWCNDLDAVFAEVRRMLKPGGVFIFATFGPDSLKELRDCWRQVDDDIHVNAFVDMHDVGDALIRNGMSEPVLSIEHIVLLYDECKQLMRELKNIGAHNINQGRRKTLTGKQRLQRVEEHYESYRKNCKLPATYEVVYGHAWRPQQEKVRRDELSSQSISLEKVRQDLKARKNNKE
jgi:malonyl-CoA O-methyltransferase